jgi:benzoyl-CoA reductase subunit C
LRRLIDGLKDTLGVSVTDDALHASIAAFNENRQLIRKLYQQRRAGTIKLSSSQMQHIVKASMVMDKGEHNVMLRELSAQVQGTGDGHASRVPMYLSGHLCQAPKLEVLDLIEECGVSVVDDDLYHGYRYVSTDCETQGDPVRALARWYIGRNWGAPCPTRIDPKADWDNWLLKAVGDSGAQGMIVLMAKFCEPHYFYYPRIKKTFEAAQVPHLLVETEHEMVALGNIRTRVESFVEMIKMKRQAAAMA